MSCESSVPAPNDSPFDSTQYYRFFNDVSPGNTISSGNSEDTDGQISMTPEQSTTSSENWQLFSQSGIYFIRNHDYGPHYQLGVSDANRSVPSLMSRSIDPGQQWLLTQRSDGSWRVANVLLGNSSSLALTVGNDVPGMQPSDSGGHWDVQINVSAGKIDDSEMLCNLVGLTVSPWNERGSRGACLHSDSI